MYMNVKYLYLPEKLGVTVSWKDVGIQSIDFIKIKHKCNELHTRQGRYVKRNSFLKQHHTLEDSNFRFLGFPRLVVFV